MERPDGPGNGETPGRNPQIGTLNWGFAGRPPGVRNQPQIIYLARGADLTDTPPDVNEAQEIRWWPLEEAVEMITRGEVVGASTVVALYRALTLA